MLFVEPDSALETWEVGLKRAIIWRVAADEIELSTSFSGALAAAAN